MSTSPFPGMDPYVEDYWSDFHHSFITYARDQIQHQLPNYFRATIKHDFWLMPSSLPSESSTGFSHGLIEIWEVPCQLVVTEFELLSFQQKTPGDIHRQFIEKKLRLKQEKINLVEIDLLRAGQREVIPGVESEFAALYQVTVKRQRNYGPLDVYSIPLHVGLPTLSIPLDRPAQEIPFDLQDVVNKCYCNGRYNLIVNYHTEPNPPLAPNDAAWADNLLRSNGKR